MSLRIDCFGLSHIGQQRSANEDQFLIADLNKSMRIYQTSLGLNHQTRLFSGSQGKLLLVADGLGGHESGERASTVAVDGVTNYILNTMDWFFRLNEHNEEELVSELKAAFQHSQDELVREIEAIPQRRGMGTTLTLAYISWPSMYVVHVGDSRCYLLRGGELKQLTTDHNLGQLIESAAQNGNRSEASSTDQSVAVGNPKNQALWNVVGGGLSDLQPEVNRQELQVGDAILLCSDGLTRYVDDKELTIALEKHESAETGCQRLVDWANERGGRDNITAVVAKFCEHEEENLSAAAADMPVEEKRLGDFDTLPFAPSVV